MRSSTFREMGLEPDMYARTAWHPVPVVTATLRAGLANAFQGVTIMRSGLTQVLEQNQEIERERSCGARYLKLSRERVTGSCHTL